MAKTANLNIRIEPDVKLNAEKLFATFGITLSDAVNIFLHKALMEGGLPLKCVNLAIMQKQKQQCRKHEILRVVKLKLKDIHQQHSFVRI